MENIKKINLGDSINLTLIKTDKFKSNLVSIYMQRLLDKDEVTKNALITSVLTNGCERYKTMQSISDKLDDMYGASILSDVSKRGEKQILNFKVLCTNEKYLEEEIFTDVIEFFNEMINNPLIENGGFSEKYLEIEKQNLIERIQSKINDKGRYALERCFEEMCSDERFSISEYGYEEDIKNISAKDLYEHYKMIIKTSPIDIIVEGDFDEEKVTQIIKEKFSFAREDVITLEREEYLKNVDEVKVIKEDMDITQGKLVMGYRTNVDYKNEDNYYALVVGNNVLGGGPHSKMFMNIREKESLCYYIYSSIEKYKSILFVSSGIEDKNYDKTVSLVKEQLQSVKNGDISQEEIDNSKSALINSMKSLTDSIGGLSDFYFAKEFGGTTYSIEQIINAIDNVNVDKIVSAVKDIELDTIYFLSK